MIISRSTECIYCGGGHFNSCYITYDDGDHCFSCGKGTRRSSEYFSYRPEISNSEFGNQVLKTPVYSTEFSPSVLEWLYGYYVYEDLIRKYRIKYCEPQYDKPESILLPIMNSKDELIAYQRRFFPKGFYSTPTVKQLLFIAGKTEGDTICIVEDYISAIRVGEAIDTLCLFGTSITDDQLSFIINHYNNVIVWMDGDEPGLNAAKKIINKTQKSFSAHNQRYAFKEIKDGQINQLVTVKQPKEHSPHEITQLIYS